LSGLCIALNANSLKPAGKTLNALKAAQCEKSPGEESFIRLIAECVIEAQRDYCRMFSIEPPK
jgi:hypothetical protein